MDKVSKSPKRSAVPTEMDKDRIKIERDHTPRELRHSDFILFVNGHRVGVSKTEAAVFSYLYRERGHVVPYGHFSRVVGADCTRKRGLRLLQQYVLVIRHKLRGCKAPYVLATSDAFGYALCKVARQSDAIATRKPSFRSFLKTRLSGPP